MMTEIHKMKPPVILLMGRKVEKAFGFRSGEFLKVRLWKGEKFIVFPHPSSTSYWWNHWDNRQRAEIMLKKLVHTHGPTQNR